MRHHAAPIDKVDHVAALGAREDPPVGNQERTWSEKRFTSPRVDRIILNARVQNSGQGTAACAASEDLCHTRIDGNQSV